MGRRKKEEPKNPEVIDQEPESKSSDETLKKYFFQIGKFSLLTREEEVALAEKIEGGGKKAEKAKKTFVEANYRLVVTIAKRFLWFSGNFSLMDMIQEGNIGLMRAVDRFDHKKGFRFSTYASWWIRHEIIRALHDNTFTIHVPVHAAEKIRKIKRVTYDLWGKLEREPTPEEIADVIGLATEEVEGLLSISQRTVLSLQKPVNEEDARTLEDLIVYEQVGQEELLTFESFVDSILDIIEDLSPYEQVILKMRFGLGDDNSQTLKAIGEKFGVCRERVRQIEVALLEKIRHRVIERGIGDEE